MKINKKFDELKKLDKELLYLKKHVVVVGVISEEFVDGISVKEYAEYNEYGTSNIPARPFFRYSTENQMSKSIITDRIKSEVDDVINFRKTGKQALDSLGLFVVGRIKQSIISGPWQSNAPSTIKIKGKATTLRDTGTLLKSISYEIRGK